MPSLKEIKGRITSVSGTLKITSAMKLVASATLHKAQAAIDGALPYQQQLVSVIGEWLKTPGRAVITVTHDLTMARQYGTHTLLMREGRCVAQGETEAVMTPENLEKVYGVDIAQIMRAALRAWL